MTVAVAVSGGMLIGILLTMSLDSSIMRYLSRQARHYRELAEAPPQTQRAGDRAVQRQAGRDLVVADSTCTYQIQPPDFPNDVFWVSCNEHGFIGEFSTPQEVNAATFDHQFLRRRR